MEGEKMSVPVAAAASAAAEVEDLEMSELSSVGFDKEEEKDVVLPLPKFEVSISSKKVDEAKSMAASNVARITSEELFMKMEEETLGAGVEQLLFQAEEDDSGASLVQASLRYITTVASYDKLGNAYFKPGSTSRGSSKKKAPESLEDVDVAELSGSTNYSAGSLDDEHAASGLWKDEIEEDVFKRHTKWSGLVFNNKDVERKFLNGHAKLHKQVVYTGYLLQIAVGIYFLVQSALVELYRSHFCKTQANLPDPVLAEEGITFCQEMFNMNKVEAASFVGRWQFFLIAVFPLLFFNCFGIFLNWYIHSRSWIEKRWAIWAVFCVYAAELMFIILIVLLDAQTFYMWPIILFLVYVLLFTISLWFTGTLFLHNLLLFASAAILYFGISIPIVVRENGIADETDKGKFASFFRILLYLSTAPLTIVFGGILLFGSYLDELTCRRRFLQRVMISYQQGRIIKHKSRSERLQKRLLENMLPSFIVDELKKKSYAITTWSDLKTFSKRHSGVSIMFADIVGFTSFSQQVDPSRVMAFLNDLFQVFDNLNDEFHVYKVETVGDCYVAAVGVVTGSIVTTAINLTRSVDSVDYSSRTSSRAFSSKESKELLEYRKGAESPGSRSTGTFQFQGSAAETNTIHMVGFAKQILLQSQSILKPKLHTQVELRIGIHTGPIMSGLVGTKNMRFCLFGDTMNTAARMEQNGKAQTIHASEAVVSYSPEEPWEKRKGLVEVKGKGRMQTYFLDVIDEGEESRRSRSMP